MHDEQRRSKTRRVERVASGCGVALFLIAIVAPVGFVACLAVVAIIRTDLGPPREVTHGYALIHVPEADAYLLQQRRTAQSQDVTPNSGFSDSTPVRFIAWNQNTLAVGSGGDWWWIDLATDRVSGPHGELPAGLQGVEIRSCEDVYDGLGHGERSR